MRFWTSPWRLKVKTWKHLNSEIFCNLAAIRFRFNLSSLTNARRFYSSMESLWVGIRVKAHHWSRLYSLNRSLFNFMSSLFQTELIKSNIYYEIQRVSDDLNMPHVTSKTKVKVTMFPLFSWICRGKKHVNLVACNTLCLPDVVGIFKICVTYHFHVCFEMCFDELLQNNTIVN